MTQTVCWERVCWFIGTRFALSDNRHADIVRFTKVRMSVELIYTGGWCSQEGLYNGDTLF